MPADQPKPLTARQDAFCRLVASGLSIAQAARDAGFTPLNARRIGAELWAHPAAQKRISEYAAQFEAERRAAQDEACDRLDEIAARALEAGHFRTALRATEVKLRMLGLDAPGRRDRSEEDRHIVTVHEVLSAKKAAEAKPAEPAAPAATPPLAAVVAPVAPAAVDGISPELAAALAEIGLGRTPPSRALAIAAE